jgi:alpha-L-fucosidase
MTRLTAVLAAAAAAALLQASARPQAVAADIPPSPVSPVPSARQLAWHAREFYGFLHFGVNTFTDKEWGYGDENPAIFNPTAFDARQWVRVAKEAGMTGLIITAKHHDGFCLWPSRFTDHSVKRSPLKGGQTDIVGDLARACREAGLFLGVYLSPWDRNHAAYGRPEYLTYYRNQLRELLTQYGEVAEVWFDGANGGDGYYGGARETRQIDRATYYEWPETWSLVRQLQPKAVMFSDAGPDVRWVGNESGLAFESTFYGLDRAASFPGDPDYARHRALGRIDGSDWVPAEVDVSIRPGWFYHAAEDTKVKSVDALLDIYYSSVGRGTNLLLNVPPDTRGLIAEPDAQALRQFRSALDATFRDDLARRAKATASNVRGSSPRFAASQATDAKADSYWATDDGVKVAHVELEWPSPVTFDHVVLQEQIALGQRVEGWAVEAAVDGGWKSVGTGTTIGYKRILRCSPVTASRIRVKITRARACPTLAAVSVHLSGRPVRQHP